MINLLVIYSKLYKWLAEYDPTIFETLEKIDLEITPLFKEKYPLPEWLYRDDDALFPQAESDFIGAHLWENFLGNYRIYFTHKGKVYTCLFGVYDEHLIYVTVLYEYLHRKSGVKLFRNR